MLLSRSLFIVTALFIIKSSPATATESNDKDQCSLYMAPSSTLGPLPPPNSTPDLTDSHPQLSMYAGINFKPGQIIGRPEIAIPIIHVEEHNGITPNSDYSIRSDFFQTMEHFTWNPQTVSARYEAMSANALMMIIPGVGSLGNQHPSLVYNADWDINANVDRTITTHKPSSSSTSSSSSPINPGRGSTSHYFDMTLTAQKDIPQGMEILVSDLGLEEDPSIEYTQEDFHFAETTLQQITQFFKTHESKVSKHPKKKQQIYDYLIKDVMKEEENDLFPHDVNDVIHQTSSPFLQSYPELHKSIEWLEEHGQCLDGLYVKESPILLHNKYNIHQNENQHGAFASKSFRKGEVVSPSPLMMIPDKSYLDMYLLRHVENRFVRDENKGVQTQQLLMNYCYGHEESSLVFYPYGMNVNYINHQSSKEGEGGGGSGANVKLVWTNATYHQSELLNDTPDNLFTKYDTDVVFRFGMDIVATRDIEANEEIFLDYGHEWETKWKEHVESLTTTDYNVDNDNHRFFRNDAKKALELNSLMDKALSLTEDDEYYSQYKHFFTSDELEEMYDEDIFIIPDTVMTACYLTWREMEDDDENLVKRKKPESQVWYKFDKDTEKSGHALYECAIDDRHEVLRKSGGDEPTRIEYEYTISFLTPGEKGKLGLVFNVPQSFIRYVDEPYTSHIHSTNGFRHYIGIPDEIFPEAWRDLRKKV